MCTLAALLCRVLVGYVPALPSVPSTYFICTIRLSYAVYVTYQSFGSDLCMHHIMYACCAPYICLIHRFFFPCILFYLPSTVVSQVVCHKTLSINHSACHLILRSSHRHNTGRLLHASSNLQQLSVPTTMVP